MKKLVELKKLEKIVLMTRLSSMLFLIVLVLGSLVNIPLNILAPVVVVAALALVIFIGVPTQRRLHVLRREIANEGRDINE